MGGNELLCPMSVTMSSTSSFNFLLFTLRKCLEMPDGYLYSRLNYNFWILFIFCIQLPSNDKRELEQLRQRIGFDDVTRNVRSPYWYLFFPEERPGAFFSALSVFSLVREYPLRSLVILRQIADKTTGTQEAKLVSVSNAYVTLRNPGITTPFEATAGSSFFVTCNFAQKSIFPCSQ